MKKKLSLLCLSTTLLLSGCSFLGYSLTNSENSSNNGQNTSLNTSEDDSKIKDSLVVDGKRVKLNEYGDYVEYVDSSKSGEELLKEYKALTKKVKGDVYNDVMQSSYQKGLLDFFDINNKVEVIIDISSSELKKLNNDYNKDGSNTESFRICNLDIFMNGLKLHYEEVGIRQKGNLSRRNQLEDNDVNKINLIHYKLSFEETFDDEFTTTPKKWSDVTAKNYRKERKFFGINKIDMRWNRNKDTTYIREYYAYEMYRANGALSPRSNVANLKMKIDGNTVNLGLFLAIETINKSFINRNFINSYTTGDLYKLSWGSGEGATFNDTSSRLFGVSYLTKSNGNFVERGYTYDLKTNKTTSNHSIIKSFISDLQNEHGATCYNFFNTRTVYDEFLTYTACAYLLGDPDDLRGNYNNTYAYFVPQSNQLVLIPIDHDRVLGATGDEHGANPTGHHGANSGPYDVSTGYSNNGKLFGVSVVSSNGTTVKQNYASKVETIINNGWMEMSKYQSYFNIVKNNYSTKYLQTDNKVLTSVVGLNLKEGTSVGGESNLDVETYLSLKKTAFNAKK